jgi:Tfp pilus assembly protein PilO
MKGSDRAVLLAIPIVGLLIAFYMLVLSPKRAEVSKLNDEVTALQSSIDQQEQTAAFAEQARKQFPRYYGRMVVLGKAVPDSADQASMLVQLSAVSDQSNVKFNGLELGQGESAAEASTPPVAPAAPAAGTTAAPTGTAPSGEAAAPSTGTAPAAASSSTAGSTPAAAPAAAPAPATEAAAATLPIGATVGPAGLPTLPYDMFFTGGYFDVADFIGGVDGLVHTSDQGGRVTVEGRLLTIDGFALQGGAPGADPTLDAQFVMTSYVTPSDQGLTLGASPAGPATAPPTQPSVTPASAVSP